MGEKAQERERKKATRVKKYSSILQLLVYFVGFSATCTAEVQTERTTNLSSVRLRDFWYKVSRISVTHFL